jgi:hypothetical protein
MKYIGIAGFAGSGKDTAADAISSIFPQAKSHFLATPLKNTVSDLFMIPSHHMYDRTKKEEINKEWGKSPRQIMQDFGMMIRQNFGDDFWIKRLDITLGYLYSKEHEQDNIIVVPDIRFQNEIDWIYSKGGILLVIQRDSIEPMDHPSERINILNLKEEQTHYIQNNSTISAFKVSVINAVQSYILSK